MGLVKQESEESSESKEPKESNQSEVISDPEGDPASEEKNPAKKRTKTGCLTCRKRRIKCGEERPICRNCVKSKRECSGYVQPLVYKQHNGAHNSLVYEPYPVAPSYVYPAAPPSHIPVQHTLHTIHHPTYHHLHTGQHQHHPPFQHVQPPLPASNHSFVSGALPGTLSGSHVSWAQPHNGQSIYNATAPPHSMQTMPRSDLRTTAETYDGSSQYTFTASSQFPPEYHDPWLQPPMEPSAATTSRSSSHPSSNLLRSSSLENPSEAFHHSYASVNSHAQHEQHVATLMSSNTSSFDSDPYISDHSGRRDFQHRWNNPPINADSIEQHTTGRTPRYRLAKASSAAAGKGHSTSESSWMAHGHASSTPADITTYHPSRLQAPLYDDKSKEIFHWFVTVTSGCISIFERQVVDLATGSSQSLWGYLMPSLSLSNSALAHAILALSSLHHAKVNMAAEELASKHFTYAVRRVGKLLDLPKRRYEVATLAAVLLLGFYEVMAADHSRWNLHLAGAKQLVTEHDYAGFTRSVRAMRTVSMVNNGSGTQGRDLATGRSDVNMQHRALLHDSAWNVDEVLISRLYGKKVSYDLQSQTNFPQSWYPDLTEKQVEEFQAKLDLRWWYCKQDIFQSMVSGDPLLLPFKEWIYCPPRGQIGKANLAHATMDHLLLIMGRLTNFGGEDRTRKQRAIAAQGGQWKPPPGLFGPPSLTLPSAGTRAPKDDTLLANSRADTMPIANEGRVRQSKPPPQPPTGAAGPSFHGMMPPPSEPVQMSPSFYRMDAKLRGPQADRTPSREPPSNLESETAKALAEHAAIVQAFDTFEESLGYEFQPQAIDERDTPTPFGAALRYINHSVACIWAFYYVGRILLHRFHPHMPPAAMVAAGVVAQQTAPYAQKVGQICAALYSAASPAAPHGEIALDTYWAGALIESTFPLLFAAIQYRDAHQRSWTISKLQTIAQITGWKSAAAIAAALETAWEKMGQAGRAPPYWKTMHHNEDARLKHARTDAAATSSTRKSSILDDHEGQFVIHDRNLIDRQGPARVHWALGILSVEEDIRRLNLGEN